MRGHARDRVRRKVVVGDDLEQRVGGRMRVPARRVELERRLRQRPALAEAVGEARRIGIARHSGRHPLRSFEDALRAGEAVAREIGGEQPVRRGLRGVQLLRIGGVAQELPEPGGLRARGAEGVQHRGVGQPEQAADARCRSQRAGRAGRVEHLVVRAAEEFAHANADFVPGDRGDQQVAAGSPDRLRDGERGRKHHRSRMKDRAVVHVVLLGEVRGGRIDHRREQRTRAPARDQHLARDRRRDPSAGRSARWSRRRARPCPPARRPTQSSSRSSARRSTGEGMSRNAARGEGPAPGWEGVHRRSP